MEGWTSRQTSDSLYFLAVVTLSVGIGTNSRAQTLTWLRDGSVLGIARAVSADGRFIVGVGYNARTGRREAFLLDTQPLTVIPEPTTMSLFALGVGAVSLVRRRKQ